MKKFVSIFTFVFTILNMLIYILLMIVLMAGFYDKTIMEKFNAEWWVPFLVLQIWYNVVVARKAEIEPKEK